MLSKAHTRATFVPKRMGRLIGTRALSFPTEALHVSERRARCRPGAGLLA